MTKPLGLSEEVNSQIESLLRKSLLGKETAQVFVFGSRSAGGFRKYSDLDLWIESTPPLTKTEVAGIAAAFDDSTLSIKVDVVTPETCFEEYKESIMTQRKLWFSL